jgi:hypothetical protein
VRRTTKSRQGQGLVSTFENFIADGIFKEWKRTFKQLKPRVMNSPSNELKDLAMKAKSKTEEKVIQEWADLFCSLRMFKDCYAFGDPTIGADGDLELWSRRINFDIPPNGHFGTIQVVKFEPGQEIDSELMWFDIEVSLFRSGKAYISCSYDIQGFDESRIFLRGTYEQVFRRMVELNNMVMSQLPEVPADLKP